MRQTLPQSKMTTLEMEIGLAEHFNVRVNMIVPNLHWAMFPYELDLLVLTKAGYATEVEIKISKSDLKRDKKKRHNHKDPQNRIKYLYFAIPKALLSEVEHIPDHAGIIIVRKEIQTFGRWGKNGYERFEKEVYPCRIFRQPPILGKYKWNEKERTELARLAAMRVWTMKRKFLRVIK